MDFPEARKFLLASYHDLPNILFVGSLILGSLLGYLPLVWLALGLILNGATTSAFQYLIGMLRTSFPSTFDTGTIKSQITGEGIQRCNIGFQYLSGVPDINNFKSPSKSKDGIIAPSYWVSSSVFFVIFSIYNSIRIMMRAPKGRVDSSLVSARKAFSISTLVGLCIFLLLMLVLRVYTECDTITGMLLGILVGGGVAIGFWHILDACGTGKLPDVLQVVGSMAPDQSKTQTPVMCVAPAE